MVLSSGVVVRHALTDELGWRTWYAGCLVAATASLSVCLNIQDSTRHGIVPGWVLPGIAPHAATCSAPSLFFLLPGAGDPGVDRRARHGAAVLPGLPRIRPAAAVPEWRRPPTNRWPRDAEDELRLDRPSLTCAEAPAAPRKNSVSARVTTRRSWSRAHAHTPPPGQPRGQLDGEHHARLGYRHPAAHGGLVHITAGLPHRDRETARQRRRCLGHPHPSRQQVSGSVDPLSLLPSTHPTVTSHAINILPNMSLTGRDTPRPLQPPVAQRDIKAEVAHCVGGVSTWALSTSAEALPAVLALCPPGVRVAAWHAANDPPRAAGRCTPGNQSSTTVAASSAVTPVIRDAPTPSCAVPPP